MRQGIENLQFHHFRVHHDQAQVFRALRIQDRSDDGVDTNGFTRAGGASDEQMGHLRQIGNERTTGDIFAECDRNLRLRAGPVFTLQQFAHADRRRVLVGYFHADRGFAGDGREDPHRLRAHPEGDVLIEAGDFFDAHPGGWDHFVTGDDGTDVNLTQRHFHAKFTEDAQEILGVGAMLLFAVADAGLGLLLQQTEQRKVVGGVVALGETGPRSLLGLFGLDDIELVAGGDGEGLLAGRGWADWHRGRRCIGSSVGEFEGRHDLRLRLAGRRR